MIVLISVKAVQENKEQNKDTAACLSCSLRRQLGWGVDYQKKWHDAVIEFDFDSCPISKALSDRRGLQTRQTGGAGDTDV
jgi:hypothetical protein